MAGRGEFVFQEEEKVVQMITSEEKYLYLLTNHGRIFLRYFMGSGGGEHWREVPLPELFPEIVEHEDGEMEYRRGGHKIK